MNTIFELKITCVLSVTKIHILPTIHNPFNNILSDINIFL